MAWEETGAEASGKALGSGQWLAWGSLSAETGMESEAASPYISLRQQLRPARLPKARVGTAREAKMAIMMAYLPMLNK
jgi:hypothetical protein